MKGVKRIPEKVTLDIREKKNVFRKERVKEGQKDTRYQREKKERTPPPQKNIRNKKNNTEKKAK